MIYTDNNESMSYAIDVEEYHPLKRYGDTHLDFDITSKPRTFYKIIAFKEKPGESSEVREAMSVKEEIIKKHQICRPPIYSSNNWQPMRPPCN